MHPLIPSFSFPAIPISPIYFSMVPRLWVFAIGLRARALHLRPDQNFLTPHHCAPRISKTFTTSLYTHTLGTSIPTSFRIPSPHVKLQSSPTRLQLQLPHANQAHARDSDTRRLRPQFIVCHSHHGQSRTPPG